MKNKRHDKILQIIDEKTITTQEELIDELQLLKIPVTQATISRDIKQLRLVKTLDKNKVYKYTVMQSIENEEISQKFISFFSESVLSLEVAENIVCIKCFMGMAGAACITFDAMEFKNVVGTIAGNDTIFVLVNTKNNAENLEVIINQYLDKSRK